MCLQCSERLQISSDVCSADPVLSMPENTDGSVQNNIISSSATLDVDSDHDHADDASQDWSVHDMFDFNFD